MRLAVSAVTLLLFTACTIAETPERPATADTASVAATADGALSATSTEPVDAQQLVGTWKVDLRPLPGDSAYFQEFVVTAVNGKTFTGTFYGTPIEQARINTDWGAVRIAFVTADQSGPYNHSAVLSGGKLDGLTNSTGRDFLSYWSATK